VVHSKSAGDTRALGARIGRRLEKGTVIGLFGALGSGKTCLVQGLAEGLGVNPALPVSSPTFVLINEYEGPTPLFHFDLYRIGEPREIIELGWEDYLDKDGVIVIEWAERMGGLLPDKHIHIGIEITGENSREIRISGPANIGLSGDK